MKSYGWHEGIEHGEFCMYRACEWGQIRRTQDSREGARVISKRAAVATQAIVVRGDSPYTVPADLHNVLVGVNMHAGSHYVTLALLEGYLKRHEIRPGHVGGPKQRLRFLEDGKLGAAALMEPWITVAVKRGHKIICEAFYEGAEVGVPSLDPEGYASIDRAIRSAVDSINDSIEPYLKYMIREVPKEIAELSEGDFYLGRFRYSILGRTRWRSTSESTTGWSAGTCCPRRAVSTSSSIVAASALEVHPRRRSPDCRSRRQDVVRRTLTGQLR